MFILSRFIIIAFCMSYLSYCLKTAPEQSVIGILIGSVIAFYGLSKASLRNWLLKETEK